MYLKRDDLVVVISGVHSGQQGRVLRVIRDTDHVLVQGVNLRYKHLRRSQKNPQGGRIRKEAPLHVSKIQLVDPRRISRLESVFARREDGKFGTLRGAASRYKP